jgi:hypothetical protein
MYNGTHSFLISVTFTKDIERFFVAQMYCGLVLAIKTV